MTVTLKNPQWQRSVGAGQVLDIGFTASFPYGYTPSVNSAGFTLAKTPFRAEEGAEQTGAGADAAGQGASAGLSVAAAVGIAVGGSAAVAALIVGAIVARKKMQRRNGPSTPDTPGPETIQFTTVSTASPAVN